VYITFSKDPTIEIKGLNKMLNALGAKIVNFKNAKISLSTVNIKYVLGDSNYIIKKMSSIYKKKILQDILFILGSSESLGNPMELVNTIGSGIHDFYAKPMESLEKGNFIEMATSLNEGTSSLLSNTISGTSGLLARTTGALSSGADYLSGDAA